MLSELAGVVAKAFEARLSTCEAMCFAISSRSTVISVLIVDSTLAVGGLVEYTDYGDYEYEVLSVQDLRALYRLDRIETFTVFLRSSVVIKDEYQDLFDAMRTLQNIVLDENAAITRLQGRVGADDTGKTSVASRHSGGYFGLVEQEITSGLQDPKGYKILCSGVPYIHKFIKRQCFELLQELEDVTRSIEFAFYRNGRLAQSIFTIELYQLDHVNKAEFEKRLSLFCAMRNRYPTTVDFRLFRSNFGDEPQSAFMAAVSRKILTDHFPRTSSPQGFTRAISPLVVAILLSILKTDDLAAAKAKLDDLVRGQLHHVMAHRMLPGEITNREKVAYQLDLNTDTMVMTQKGPVLEEFDRHLRVWETPIHYKSDVFRSFMNWKGQTDPSHTEATNLLFDAFCISPYRSYYFLRLVQTLLNEKG